jgi:hypothetical protein
LRRFEVIILKIIKDDCMRKNIYTAISILFIFVIASCNKTDNQEKIVAVEKEFSFQPWETLSESGGTFSLITSTITKQNCSGTKVNVVSQFNNGGINVKVNGLINPLVCDGKAQLASDTTPILGLAKGKYTFKINLKDAIVNEGTLIVEDNKYLLNMSKLDGIEMPTTEILRVPKGLIWGYVNYEPTQETQFVKFETKLKKIATAQSDIPKGDYGYFVINDQSKVNVKAIIDQPKVTTKHLLYYLNSNYTELKNLVDEFREPVFQIKFFTSDGKVF